MPETYSSDPLGFVESFITAVKMPQSRPADDVTRLSTNPVARENQPSKNEIGIPQEPMKLNWCKLSFGVTNVALIFKIGQVALVRYRRLSTSYGKETCPECDDIKLRESVAQAHASDLWWLKAYLALQTAEPVTSQACGMPWTEDVALKLLELRANMLTLHRLFGFSILDLKPELTITDD